MSSENDSSVPTGGCPLRLTRQGIPSCSGCTYLGGPWPVGLEHWGRRQHARLPPAFVRAVLLGAEAWRIGSSKSRALGAMPSACRALG